MTYGPHVPEWIAVCERLALVREAVQATNCFAIDSSNALLARAWPMSGNEPNAVAMAGEQFAATKPADRHVRTLHGHAMDIGVVPFGGIYALVATFDGAIPLDLSRLFEPHKKPLLDLLAALPPVDGPGRSSRSASIRPPRG